MDLLFILFYVSFVIVFELQYYLKIVHYVQLSGYTCKSVWDAFYQAIKNSFVQWILYLIVFVTILVINYTNIYFLTLLLILSGVVLIISGDRFVAMRSIKYTKRVCRLLIVSFIVLVLYILFTIFCMDEIVVLVMMPIILPINYLIMLLSLVILSPIECWIRVSYVHRAKIKLASMKKLIKVGITGSYGKTSTKEILNTILSQHFYTLATPKSFNTPMGITKVILGDLNNLHEVLICEMGAKKVGEIKELCDMVDVDYGIVTSVGRQHTSTFGSINNIYRTKKELPDYLTNKSCVFNLCNKYVHQMYNEYVGDKIGVFYTKNHNLHNTTPVVKKHTNDNRYRKVFDKKRVFFAYPYFGNVYAKNVEINENGCLFDIYISKCKICSAATELVGIHNVINILLAVALAKQLGVSNENIEIGISKVKPIKARLERFEGENGAVILNNGYNSNIDSVDYSLQTVKLFNKPNILVITPGLIESKNAYEVNKVFGQKIAQVSTEVIIVKMVNRDAIYAGLISQGFDMSKVYFVSSFGECKKVISSLGKDYIVLIENDLPDNYL